MIARYLFPYWCRFLGYALVLVNIPLFLLNQDTFFTAIIVNLIVGLLLIAFSKEKIEDEHISKLRLESLQWAMYLNYIVIIISLLLYKGHNVTEVLRFNLKFPLVFFIIRFKWVLFRLNHSLKEDIKLS